MKKITVLMLIISILLLSSCSQPEEKNVVTDVGQLFTTASDKYSAYDIYLVGTKNSDSKWELDGLTSIDLSARYLEKDIPDSKFTIGTIQTIGKYQETKSEVYRRVAPTRYYRTEYGTVGTDNDTGTIVSVNFQISELLDVQATEVLTENECYAIAMNFLSLVAPDTNWDLYTLSKTGRKSTAEGKSYNHNYYGFTFRKYIDGIATTDNYGICITEYGSIMFYRRGDRFDEQEVKDLNVDYTRAETVAKDYAEELCEIRPDSQYSLTDPYFLQLGDGTYALEYGIEITYPIDDGQEITSGLIIVIPLESN